MKYLYLIWQTVNNNYDTYDSAVVVAESEDEAKKIHPSNYDGREVELKSSGNEYWSWCYLEDVQVKKIGVADESQYNERVICASYNAG